MSADLNYSYSDKISDEQTVTFGISIGVIQNNIDKDDVVISDISDPSLYSNKLNEAIFNTGFGISYKFKDLSINLSTPLLYQTQNDKLLNTAFAFASYDIFLQQKMWRVQPSVLYRYSAESDPCVDVNLLAERYEKVWLLAGYKTNKNIAIGGGLFIRNIGIGYIYEVNRSKFYAISAGSHEIMLTFASKY